MRLPSVSKTDGGLFLLAFLQERDMMDTSEIQHIKYFIYTTYHM